jgi:hypothetical protein
MGTREDLIGLLILFGLGYIFYKKIIEGKNVLEKIKGFGGKLTKGRSKI